MKKTFVSRRALVRVTAVILTLLLLSAALSSCGSSKGKTLISIGSSTLSVNDYELLLSRMKGTLARIYGDQVLKDSFWETTVGLDGSTYNDYFTSQVLETAKTYAIALYLFDQYKLTLPDSTIAEVDEEMDGLLIGDGDGSKSRLNQILSAYGMNYDMLRAFYITEAKVEYLQTYLYGADGSKILSNVKEEYMKEQYVCFKQIFLASYYYVCEKDAYGNTIYYDEDGKTFLYDTENGITMTGDDGKIITDKNGDEIYFDEEGNILYDKENGMPMYVTDSDGNYKTEDYDEEALEKIAGNIELIASQIKDGDFEDFEDLMKEYSEDTEGIEEYESGYFLEKDGSYGYEYLNDIAEALAEMEIGETRLIESDYGYHLIMKYECAEGAYAEEANAVWFGDFSSSLIEYLFLQETDKYKSDVKIDAELFATVDMKSVTHNYYY